MTLHRAFIMLGPLGFGLTSACLPLDANFDLANYHFHNAWALLHHRFEIDFLASGQQSFFNPILDVPFFLANGWLPGPGLAFLLGATQGLCFSCLYLLSRALLPGDPGIRRDLVAACIAGAGMASATSISELGTTFYDYLGTLGAVACFMLLARGTGVRAGPGTARPYLWIGLAGFALGLAAGLKLTNIYLAIGIGLAVPVLGQTLARRLSATAIFAAGGAIGLAIAAGAWMTHLWTLYGNPVFPYFNQVFQSPFAPVGDLRDLRFMPRGWLEALFYPFVFAANPGRVSEAPMRDFRYLALFLTFFVGPPLLFLTWKSAAQAPARRRFLWFLLTALALSHAGWLMLFSIRRYAMALEAMAPLMVVLLALEAPRRTARIALAIGLIGVLVATTQPRSWGRSDRRGFERPIVDVHLPDMARAGDMVLMTGWRPKSFLAPFFPDGVVFVRVNGADSDDLILAKLAPEMRRRVAAHPGRFLALVNETQMASLDSLTDLGLTVDRASCRAAQSSLDLHGATLLCLAARRL